MSRREGCLGERGVCRREVCLGEGVSRRKGVSGRFNPPSLLQYHRTDKECIQLGHFETCSS